MTKSKSDKAEKNLDERLMNLIKKFPDKQKRELLQILPEWENWVRRRKSPRKMLKSAYSDLDESASGYIVRNISAGGVFIKTDSPLEMGQNISLLFTFPDMETPVRVTAEVVRATSEGFGLKFDKSDENVRILSKFFEEI